MFDFVSPISGKNFKEVYYSKGVIKTRLYDYAVSPYNGVVILSDDSNCVEIKHSYNKNTYYSKFCGLNRLKVNDGQRVSSGSVIGLTKDGKTEFSIKNNIGIDVTNKFYSDKKQNKTTEKIKGKVDLTDPEYVLSKLKPTEPDVDFSDSQSIERKLSPEGPNVELSDPKSVEGMLKPKAPMFDSLREDIQRIKNLMK
jgi:hypothetical protein